MLIVMDRSVRLQRLQPGIAYQAAGSVNLISIHRRRDVGGQEPAE